MAALSSDALHRRREEQDRLLSARSHLAHSLGELSQIEKKLLQTQNRLIGIDQKLPLIQAAMAPIKNKAAIAKGLSMKLEGALEKASAVLEIFDAISVTERKLAAESPESDLRKYLVMVCRMERYLQSIMEKYPPSVEWLEDAVRFLSESRSLDAYNLQKLNYEVAESKKMNPWTELARRDPLGKAMQKLESEFARLLANDCLVIDLSLYTDTADTMSPSSSPKDANEQKRKPHSAIPMELMSRDTINKLLVISDRLNANDRISACLNLYRESRIRVARKSMATLKPEFLRSVSIESLNAAKWETIQESLHSWLTDVKVIVSVFMVKERELCHQVFQALDPADSVFCFAEIVKQSNISVFFSYAEAVASTEHRPEAMLVGLLYIVHGLKSMNPGLHQVFESCRQTIADIDSMKRILARNVYRVLLRLVKNVETQSSQVPGDGGKDLNASFVVNYMGMILRDYKGAMQEVLELQKKGTNPEVSLHMAAVSMMEALEKSLESRAWKLYEDHILAHIFLMNNYRHVLVRLKDCSALSECLGEEFRTKWNKKVEFHVKNYMKMSWDRAMSGLSRDPSLPQNNNAIRARFRSFHQAFDEIYRQQCRWLIVDPPLRDKVHFIIIDMLVPAYTAFLQSYGTLLDDGVPPQQRINRFSPDVLKNMVKNLFQGSR